MTPTARVRFTLTVRDRSVSTEVVGKLSDTVAQLIVVALDQLDLPDDPGGWSARFRGELLRPAARLSEIATAGVLVEIELSPTVGGGLRSRERAAPPPAMAAPPAPARVTTPAAPKFDADDDLDDEDGDDLDCQLSGVHAQAGTLVNRRATVRYYTRMAPARTFPLLVILSAEQIAEVRQKAVKQAESAGFQVEAGSLVELEPILPGCQCYPPRETLPADPEPVTATFWVVPQVLGRVRGARVVVRQGGRVLSEVELDVRVRKQTWAVAVGLLSLVAPYLMMGLRALRLDPESQHADGFPVYQKAGAWAVETLRPEWLGIGLLALAAGLFVALRPRKRDVFWDLAPAKR